MPDGGMSLTTCSSAAVHSRRVCFSGSASWSDHQPLGLRLFGQNGAVLLVALQYEMGDVPMRRATQDTGYGQPETDYYYAELTKPDSESWDADSDHLWGEESDPIDFYNEVNVGRIPWSDPAIVEHICQKSVAYELNDDESFKKNILLLGAFFWPDTDNAVLMEYKTNPTYQPWMEDWTATRLYEDAQSTYQCDYD